MLRGCGEGRAIAEPLPNGSTLTSEPVTVPPATAPVVVVRSAFNLDIASERIGRIVGPGHFSNTPQFSIMVPQTSLLVLPRSTEEIAQVVKLASSEGWTIAPAGKTQWLTSRVECKANLVVSTLWLHQKIEHEPADLIAVAEAGVTLDYFNKTLATNGQWLPLDPPGGGGISLGGLVATGMAGNQQHGYGRPRGSVIGMKVVLADGTIC